MVRAARFALGAGRRGDAGPEGDPFCLEGDGGGGSMANEKSIQNMNSWRGDGANRGFVERRLERMFKEFALHWAPATSWESAQFHTELQMLAREMHSDVFENFKTALTNLAMWAATPIYIRTKEGTED